MRLFAVGIVALMHFHGIAATPAFITHEIIRLQKIYVSSQIDYQHANDALYRWEIANGSNPAY